MHLLDKWQEMMDWPQWVQYGLMILLVGFVFLIFYWVEVIPQKQVLLELKQHQAALQRTLEEKQNVFLHLEQEMAHLEVAQNSLDTLLLLMPEHVEISAFLEKVSQQALMAGVELDSFRMLEEQDKGLYHEIPIDLSIVGSYQELVQFMRILSQSSQVITVHDFNLAPIPAKLSSHYRMREERVLMMRIVVKAYRYKGFEKISNLQPNV